MPVDGEPGAPGDPREERYAEFPLQGGHSFRRCLLRDSQIVGGGLELAGLGNGDEGANRIEIHEAEPTRTTMSCDTPLDPLLVPASINRLHSR